MAQGFFTLRRTCPACQGEGEKIEQPCRRCHGQGRVKQKRKLNIKIPPGVESGVRLRVSGEGEAGEVGGIRGDLYVLIAVADHAVFARQESALYCEILIPYTIAALGGEIKVPSLEGEEKLSIPGATQAGKIFKMKEKGLPFLQQPSVRGDLLIRVDIDVPKKMDATQKSLLKEFAKLRGEKVQVKKKGFFDRIKESF